VSQPFIAEIRMWACNFPPRGWAFCDGQLLPIGQNTALFALIGTYYGGNGTTNFALPDLRGAAHMFWSPNHGLGEQGGSTTVQLIVAQVPPHTHALMAEPRPAALGMPDATSTLARAAPPIYTQPSGAAPLAPLAPGVLSAGGGQPHNNLMPYLALNFCIALQGIFPARS
jgi:microcystin-dependent protein